jgi:hypothetical protein
MAQQKKRKPGRPTESPTGPKRVALSMRTTQAVRDRLDAARSESGRSLAQEVEFRLGRTIDIDDAMEREFGSVQTQTIFRAMASALARVESKTGKPWNTDWDTGAAVANSWRNIVKEYMPDIPEDLRADSDSVGPGVAPSKPVTKYKPPKKPGLGTFDEVIEPSADEWAIYEKELAKHAKKQQAHDESNQLVLDRLDRIATLGNETASTELEKISQDRGNNHGS